ncbi:hypothetical protein [Streptomyces globisporus]
MAAAGRERRESALALSSALPAEGVRTAFGFLAHRMVEKLPPRPEETAESTPPPSPLPLPLIACDGPGEEHVFRAARVVGHHLGPCHREQQRAHWADLMARAEAHPAPPPPTWRERVASEIQANEVASGYGTRATAT